MKQHLRKLTYRPMPCSPVEYHINEKRKANKTLHETKQKNIMIDSILPSKFEKKNMFISIEMHMQ